MILFKNNENKDYYLALIKQRWQAAKKDFPDFISEIPLDAKDQNEGYLHMISGDVEKLLHRRRGLFTSRKKWKKRMLDWIQEVLTHEDVIGVHYAMEPHTLAAFREELLEFMRQVRIFAPELPIEEIGQAVRNYIVYAMFKVLNGDTTGFSRAAFGYSMLYPFTDNYLDSKKVSAPDKEAYNQIIRDKINGKTVHPNNGHQAKTCDLLQAIEDEYTKDKNTGADQLLIMMLEAQELSVKQQNKTVLLSPEERLDISLYKGGISVLIDRFFVHKPLTEADKIFYLGLGFFLQLADDLQDIGPDSTHLSNQTLFTVDVTHEHTEALVNQLLHFIHNLMEEYQIENQVFKDFLLKNCNQLIFTSIVGSKEFFSEPYLKKIEKLLPVSLPYVEKAKANLPERKESTTQEQYMKLLDEMLII